MSCSILALPYAMAWVIGSLVMSGASTNTADMEFTTDNYIDNHTTDNMCNDIHVITEANFIEKSLETPFMDKEILMKTLEEHGVVNIKEESGTITGEIDTYSLAFKKMEADKPYFLTINYLAQNNPEEKLNDLSSEYALNVQEESYLSIIEKLKENNMQVEEEEVLDDNTIVLTVNLEN